MSFKNSCQKAADVLSLTVDGKQKEFDGDATYAHIKTLLKNIQKSAYFEKINQSQPQSQQQLQCQQSIETPDLSELFEKFFPWDDTQGIPFDQKFYTLIGFILVYRK